jgi:hypothetical protein
MFLQNGDSVGVNYLLRNQQAQMSLLVQGDAQCSIAPVSILPYNGLENIDAFADTTEILLNRYADGANLTAQVSGAIQDAMTLPVSWLKLSWQEDWERDPLGNTHRNKMDMLMAKKNALEARKSAGEFDEDGELQEVLDDLDTAIRSERARFLRRTFDETPQSEPVVLETGDVVEDPRTRELRELESGEKTPDLRDVPHFKGFVVDQIDAEDVYWDWNITRPEDFYESDWVAIKHKMTRDEVISKFVLDDDEIDQLGGVNAEEGYDTTSDEDTREIEGDGDTAQAHNKIDVWEFWYKENRTVYYFTEHYPDWLRKTSPEATWEGWYPIFPLVFNRVSGMFLGRSTVELSWALQQEYNELRTHDREARNASYPRYIVNVGMFDEGELEKLETAAPFAVIEMKNADQVKQHFHEVQTVKYDPQKYGIGLQRTRVDLEAMGGLPSSGLGAVGGAGLATEVAFAGKNLEAQSAMMGRRIEDWLTNLFVAMAQIAYETLTTPEITAIVGDGAFVPEDRMRYLAMIDVRAGVSGRPDSDKLTQFIIQYVQLSAALGTPANGPELLKQLLDASDLRLDLRKLLPPPAPPQVPMPVMGGQSGGGGQPQAGGVPSPAQLPGNAQTAGAGGL